MLIWIINPYGNLPREGWRDYRSTMIAKALQINGHQTVWWVSNFEHRTKQYRSDDYKTIKVTPYFQINLVPVNGYNHHISMARIRYERSFSSNFYKLSRGQKQPAVIILADPSLFYSHYVVRYAKENNIPLVVDILDLWPELFRLALPERLVALGKVLFWPLYRRRKRLLKYADALVVACHDYLDIAKEAAPHTRIEVVNLGLDLKEFEMNMARPELLECVQLPTKGENDIWGIYAGTLGSNYDITTILNAAELLKELNPNVHIIIAGEGPLKDLVELSVMKNRLDNVHYLGKIPATSLPRLYSLSDFALSAYRDLSTVAMPVKAFDYLAAGLPIVNSLKRDLGKLIVDEYIGLQYEAENPKSLAMIIDRICRDSTSRQEMADRARVVAERYDSVQQHMKFVYLLEQLCSEDGIRN